MGDDWFNHSMMTRNEDMKNFLRNSQPEKQSRIGRVIDLLYRYNGAEPKLPAQNLPMTPGMQVRRQPLSSNIMPGEWDWMDRSPIAIGKGGGNLMEVLRRMIQDRMFRR